MGKRVLLILAIALLALAGGPVSAGGPYENNVGAALAAQDRYNSSLLAIDGVVGTAVGMENGGAVVQVFLERPGVGGIPVSLDGVRVRATVTGKITAIDHKEKGAVSLSPKSRWPRPVPIGISTGNEGECSAGTIGARVTNGANVFALSNNHVYALENGAPLGSNVLQPGRYDTGCAMSTADIIGQLSDFQPIVFDGATSNTIDAAIAISSTANLGNATPSNGYGTPRSAITSAALNQRVQKYGRTSSLTKGVVTGINASVRVGYTSGTALFVNQIIVQSSKPVIKPGDSGSLLVTDPNRNPVGLLFAGNGSGTFAVANRIDLVLSRFGVSVDGS